LDSNSNILEKIFKFDQVAIRIDEKIIAQYGINRTINLNPYKKLYYFAIDNAHDVDPHFNFNNKYKIINYSDILNKIYYSNVSVEINNLPDGLKILWTWNCNLNDEDMINLPKELKELDCSHNLIMKLDNLPLGLKKLICSNNKISQLDFLPETLEYIDCSHNEITHLDDLPNGLIYLECSHNSIITLNSLPITLVEVFAKSNKIELVLNLPPKLSRACFTENPLVTKPKCSNSLILLNYSLDSQKASTVDKIVQSGHKVAYGSYHTAKYTTYGVGIGLLGAGCLIVYPIVKACSQFL
jgi:hypothetical protein